MRECKQNRKILDDYIAGLSRLEEFDSEHAWKCSRCQAAFQEAQAVHRALRAYAEVTDRIADETLFGQSSPRIPAGGAWARVKWLGPAAAAAALVLAVAISQLPRFPETQSPVFQEMLVSMENASTRQAAQDYLSQSQLFLMGMVDGTERCEGGASNRHAHREIAKRLIERKRLLKPRLSDPVWSDLKPLLDDLELLLVSVMAMENCPGEEDLQMWRSVIDRRMERLRLLQAEGRL